MSLALRLPDAPPATRRKCSLCSSTRGDLQRVDTSDEYVCRNPFSCGRRMLRSENACTLCKGSGKVRNPPFCAGPEVLECPACEGGGVR